MDATDWSTDAVMARFGVHNVLIRFVPLFDLSDCSAGHKHLVVVVAGCVRVAVRVLRVLGQVNAFAVKTAPAVSEVNAMGALQTQSEHSGITERM